MVLAGAAVLPWKVALHQNGSLFPVTADSKNYENHLPFIITGLNHGADLAFYPWSWGHS
jgi:hypothetical protein